MRVMNAHSGSEEQVRLERECARLRRLLLNADRDRLVELPLRLVAHLARYLSWSDWVQNRVTLRRAGLWLPHLELAEQALGEWGGLAVAAALRRTRAEGKLDLRRTWLSPGAADAIAAALPDGVTELDLSGNRLGRAQLVLTGRLRAVDCAGCGLGASAATLVENLPQSVRRVGLAAEEAPLQQERPSDARSAVEEFPAVAIPTLQPQRE